MTLTDAMIGAAALWLLFVVCGLPRPHGQSAAAERNVSPSLSTVPMPPIEPVLYSTSHQDMPAPGHVTPPRLDAETTPPGVVYRALGTADLPAIGLPQTLSLTEIIIVPGGVLTLENLDGSGTLVVQAGRLNLVEQDGDARSTRSPHRGGSASWLDEAPATLAPGDRITFEPGVAAVLRNQSAQPARLLAASVQAAATLAA